MISPDGRRAAWQVSIDGGGATGEHNLIVMVGSAGGGDIVHQSRVLWLEDALDVTLRWNTPRNLVVEYPARADVEGSSANADSVTISFVPVATPKAAWVHERAYKAWQDSMQKGR